MIEQKYWEYNLIELETDNHVAYNSPDHIEPVGTKNDNTTNMNFVKCVENFFSRKINYLDCGCAGGGFVVDFAERGHFSIGLEGSDYGLKHNLHNWPIYGNKILFTCDITKPFKVLKNKKQVKFDLITAWEVLEHLKIGDIQNYLNYVLNNLDADGLFIASINMSEDIRVNKHGEEIRLHQTVENEKFWRNEILKNYNVNYYPFDAIGRMTSNSFYISIKHKGAK